MTIFLTSWSLNEVPSNRAFSPSQFASNIKQPWASQMVLAVKNLLSDAGEIRNTGSIPGLGRPTGEGHGNPF